MKKRTKEEMAEYMRKRRLVAKKGDSVLLSEKQGLENAPESTTIDEVCNTRTVTPQKNDVTPDKCNTQNVTPCNTQSEPKCRIELPEKTHLIPNYGLPNCECMHCQQNTGKNQPRFILNHGPYKTAAQLKQGEVNRVSLPGDADYGGVSKYRETA